jgi:uracil-DNA glycosylase family 4
MAKVAQYYVPPGEERNLLLSEFPFYPLDSPGIPVPGDNFLEAAIALGDDVPKIEGKGDDRHLADVGNHLTYLYRRALYDPEFAINVKVKSRSIFAPMVPGHLWGAEDHWGPRPSSVMIIGKQPGEEEISSQRNFMGPASTDLYRLLEGLCIPNSVASDWYITSLVRWGKLDPASSTLPAKWIKDCLPLLWQEMRLVQPDYILCLGSEASKAVLGKGMTVSNMAGRVEELKIPMFAAGEEPRYHTAKVMTALHPAAVFRRPELYDEMMGTWEVFYAMTQGGDVGTEETDIDHRIVYKERELAAIVDSILAEPGDKVVAVDVEWQGDYPTEPGAYVRTVQFSHKDKFACCVVLKHEGGLPAFKPGMDYGIEQLRRLLLDPSVRVGGHFFRADIPWLLHLGIDLRKKYAPPVELREVPFKGGWDTSLMMHAVNETSEFKLETLATRHAGSPRYDVELKTWLDKYCKKNGMKSSDIDGYGECPGEVLYPYAAYDADVTRRLYTRLTQPEEGFLDRDMFDHSSWESYWLSHRASNAFLEMEMSGMRLDRERAESLIQVFSEAKGRRLQELRQTIRWPEFNHASPVQARELLFGPQYNGKIDKNNPGAVVSVRPEGAVTLGLTPIKSAGARPKDWAMIKARGQEDVYNASTDKEVLGILAQDNAVVGLLRDLRFVEQVLKTYLRLPTVDEEGLPLVDENGHYMYEKGMLGLLHADGQVRTHLRQTLETARAASRRPNLQNISKRREKDYRRILGDLYRYPIRTIFRARPGHVFVEADYTGAELAGIAWMSGDPNMIAHVARNALPEDHPDHYDIHSQSAVRAFNLSCEPTKAGLASIDMSHLRIGAKTVNFGIPYGRGAEAIARAAKEEGVDMTPEEAQRLIDIYFEMYPGTHQFLKSCRERVTTERWISNCFGRFRRFQPTSDTQVLGEMERQAQNFPIQSMVADAMSRALDNVYWYRESHDVDYNIILQIHDAILLEVPFEHVERVYEEVLPVCMVDNVSIVPTNLNGIPLDDTEYHFSIDKEVGIHWGEYLSYEDAVKYGIPTKYAAKPTQEVTHDPRPPVDDVDDFRPLQI